MPFPCTSKPFPTGIHRLPSCCAKDGVRAGKSENARWPTSRNGPKAGPTPCAVCCGTNPLLVGRCLRHRAFPTPRPCRRSARHTAEAGSGADHRPRRSCARDRVVAIIVARVPDPGSGPATARVLPGPRRGIRWPTRWIWVPWTGTTCMRPWTGCQRARSGSNRAWPGGISKKAPCDLTPVCVEGHHCPLAKRGYSRDGRKGKAADRIRVAVRPGRLSRGDGFAGPEAAGTLRAVEGRSGGRPGNADRGACAQAGDPAGSYGEAAGTHRCGNAAGEAAPERKDRTGPRGWAGSSAGTGWPDISRGGSTLGAGSTAGATLRGRPTQGPAQTHRQGLARAQLPHPAHRPCHHHPQPVNASPGLLTCRTKPSVCPACRCSPVPGNQFLIHRNNQHNQWDNP